MSYVIRDFGFYEGAVGWSQTDCDADIASLCFKLAIDCTPSNVKIIIIKPGETPVGEWKACFISREP